MTEILHHKNPCIYIVSESKVILTDILNELDEFNNCNCITLQRIRDLFYMIPSVQPSVIVLHTLIESKVLKELNYILKKKTPVLLLTKRHNTVTLPEFEKILPFSVSLDSAIYDKSLSLNLRSIIQMEAFSSNIIIKEKPEDHNDYSYLESKYILELDQKRNLLDKVKSSLEHICLETDFYTRKELKKVLNTIKINKKNATKSWEDFKLYFEKNNPQFLKEITATFPTLTVRDLKYCCYLKMNMSNENIMQLLGINLESVRTHKYRLKKKLMLPKQKDLKSFIHEFERSELEKNHWVN